MDFLALADFNLVARHGGVGRAARASGRPKATLSRRVAELEAALNLRLFERGARKLTLTEEGRALHERTGVLLAELDETAAAIAAGGATPKGRLRVSVPLLFSQTAMGGIAARFARLHPEVRLEVTTDDRPVDMVEEGYDLVIRVNPEPDETLVGRIVLRDRLVLVAHPSVARPLPGESLRGVVRGAFERSTWRIRTEGGPQSWTVEPVLALSSMVMIRDAVRTGIAPACLPLSLVSRDLAEGRLVCWADVDAPEIALWTLYPSRRLLSARVLAFLDLLKQVFPQGTPDELAAVMRV